ncbi:hypothetical protein MJ575_21465 [Klebsiella pneumoniae]|nr:hypothetical protein MJ575_21465 [Klebsiella pneumoniae]
MAGDHPDGGGKRASRGIEPRVALQHHSNFGSADCPSITKMRKTTELVKARAPELMIDGEMHGDAALVESIRNDRMPDSPLKGRPIFW